MTDYSIVWSTFFFIKTRERVKRNKKEKEILNQYCLTSINIIDTILNLGSASWSHWIFKIHFIENMEIHLFRINIFLCQNKWIDKIVNIYRPGGNKIVTSNNIKFLKLVKFLQVMEEVCKIMHFLIYLFIFL